MLELNFHSTTSHLASRKLQLKGPHALQRLKDTNIFNNTHPGRQGQARRTRLNGFSAIVKHLEVVVKLLLGFSQTLARVSPQHSKDDGVEEVCEELSEQLNLHPHASNELLPSSLPYQ